MTDLRRTLNVSKKTLVNSMVGKCEIEDLFETTLESLIATASQQPGSALINHSFRGHGRVSNAAST